jgi:hypothetical protein
VVVDGFPPFPTQRIATIMGYRAQTLGPRSYVIHWREIGYFADCASGEPEGVWVNPLTGAVCDHPVSFQEGPGRHEVTLEPDGRISITLVQPGAVVQSVALEWSQEGSRLRLLQVERKMRGAVRPDGTMPPPGTPGVFQGMTELAFFMAKPSADPAVAIADCSGVYRFEIAGIPPWMGFGERSGRTGVTGVIRKTTADAPPSAHAALELERLFPGWLQQR